MAPHSAYLSLPRDARSVLNHGTHGKRKGRKVFSLTGKKQKAKKFFLFAVKIRAESAQDHSTGQASVASRRPVLQIPKTRSGNDIVAPQRSRGAMEQNLSRRHKNTKVLTGEATWLRERFMACVAHLQRAVFRYLTRGCDSSRSLAPGYVIIALSARVFNQARKPKRLKPSGL